jgi:hypothetical protein
VYCVVDRCDDLTNCLLAEFPMATSNRFDKLSHLTMACDRNWTCVFFLFLALAARAASSRRTWYISYTVDFSVDQ